MRWLYFWGGHGVLFIHCCLTEYPKSETHSLSGSGIQKQLSAVVLAQDLAGGLGSEATAKMLPSRARVTWSPLQATRVSSRHGN